MSEATSTVWKSVRMRMRGWKVGVPYAAWAFELGHYVRGFRSDWEYGCVVVSELDSAIYF